MSLIINHDAGITGQASEPIETAKRQAMLRLHEVVFASQNPTILRTRDTTRLLIISAYRNACGKRHANPEIQAFDTRCGVGIPVPRDSLLSQHLQSAENTFLSNRY